MKHLSSEQRWDIVFTWKRLKSMRATMRELGVSYKAVQLWVNRYKTTGTVTEMQKSGRKRAMSDAAATTAMEMLLSGQHGYADGVARQLVNEGIMTHKVHKTTLIRSAKRAAKQLGQRIMVSRRQPRKQLSGAVKAKRLQFALKNKNTCWSKVAFSDRKRFMYRYPGHKVRPLEWVREGQKREAGCVNHAMSVNLYAAITRHGATMCHIVAGSSKHKTIYKNKQGLSAKNITAEEYQHVLRSTLLPGTTRIFAAKGISDWTFQQDNDPAHGDGRGIIQHWNATKRANVSFLEDWPASSPDLNPIENVWAHVQAKVDALGCPTFEEYQQAVLSHVRNISKKYISSLYKSMPRRMEHVIKAGGDKTKY